MAAILAVAAFLLRLLRRPPLRDVYHELRADLGRAILLGPRGARREHER